VLVDHKDEEEDPVVAEMIPTVVDVIEHIRAVKCCRLATYIEHQTSNPGQLFPVSSLFIKRKLS